MSDTSARHGPSPTISLNSVNLAKHQPQPTAVVGTADPSPPAIASTGAFDLTTVLLLALFAAVVVSAFWRVLLRIAIVGALTLVFAGILVVPLVVMKQ
jgi:hypothetical protein